MKTILVPLDGSVCAEQILPYVRRLALLLDARLYLLQIVADVWEDKLFFETVEEMYRHELRPQTTQREREWHSWEAQRQHAEGYLRSRAVLLQPDGVHVDFEVRLGHEAEQIVAVAAEQQAMLIALATHGYSGLKRWALGSVTDKVIHATSTPVFIVRSTEPAPVDEITLERILVPLDGSNLAKQALPLATTLVRAAHAELTLLQAVVPTIEAVAGFRPLPQFGEVLGELREQAAYELGTLVEELHQSDLSANRIVATGHAAEVIVDQARERHADLIVMATHGYGGIRRWALGSVADKVLHAATTPLLLIHARPAPG